MKITRKSCQGCQAKCCYDGVYLRNGEEAKISEFIAAYPEYFKDISEPYFEDGDWPSLEDRRKTARVAFDGYDDTFPKHFTKTRCVFVTEDDLCLLQVAAIKEGLDPWSIKPKSCWLFPLRENEEGKPELPSLESDPDYIDENYPGYISFLPCVQPDDNGISWQEKYADEINYHSTVK